MVWAIHPSGDAEMGKTPEGHRHQGAVAPEMAYRGLRQWLEQVEEMGELLRVKGRHWDPDAGWFNLGAYRSQVYDGRTIGCQITEGKHGRIHRDKYFARGEPMKVVILCGQDPLLFMLAGIPLPEISELDIAGGIRGEPI